MHEKTSQLYTPFKRSDELAKMKADLTPCCARTCPTIRFLTLHHTHIPAVKVNRYIFLWWIILS